jgi:uncharacterized protein DUF4129
VPLRRSFLRPVLLTAAVLALLAVVAFASRADRPARPDDAGERTLPVTFWDYLFTIGLLVVVGVLVLAVLLKVPLRAPQGGRFGFGQALLIIGIAGFVALAGSRMEFPDVTYPTGVEDVFVDGPTDEPVVPTVERSQPRSRAMRFRWEVAVVAGGLVLLGLVIYVAHRRREIGRAVDAHDDPATALTAAVDDSLDDLRAERDPRRAVIAAYARMERVLEGQGFPRRRAEAPLEYLARVLRGLRVRSSAVLALTELFERAKFSVHEIDADMKDEAIGALTAVRDDLRAAT